MSPSSHDTIGPLCLAWRCLRLAGHGLICILAMLALPLLGKRMQRINRWWSAKLLRILGLRVRVDGHIPDQPMLVVANHVSWVDIILLQALFYPAFLSKAEIANWPVIGRFARMAGTVFIQRGTFGTRQASEQMEQALASGRCVLLFPQATIHAELVPRRFHARLFSVSVDHGRPVQPIAIHYLPEHGPMNRHHPLAPWVEPASLVTHLWRLIQLRKLDARVTFCQPVAAADHDRRSLANASHAAVAGALSTRE